MSHKFLKVSVVSLGVLMSLTTMASAMGVGYTPQQQMQNPGGALMGGVEGGGLATTLGGILHNPFVQQVGNAAKTAVGGALGALTGQNSMGGAGMNPAQMQNIQGMLQHIDYALGHLHNRVSALEQGMHQLSEHVSKLSAQSASAPMPQHNDNNAEMMQQGGAGYNNMQPQSSLYQFHGEGDAPENATQQQTPELNDYSSEDAAE